MKKFIRVLCFFLAALAVAFSVTLLFEVQFIARCWPRVALVYLMLACVLGLGYCIVWGEITAKNTNHEN